MPRKRNALKDPRPGDQFLIPGTQNENPIHIQVYSRDPHSHLIQFFVDHVNFTVCSEHYQAFKMRIRNARVLHSQEEPHA